ncbi:hypothetical protein H5203_22370 [Pseudoalteromonas sp. SG41-1]|uniref:hypothetical protein n=1 Tax=Pseudoalteromonas sp. SG41-1 TaxID=2760979 RepID=UPI00160489D3|nr:hypothetical protein [Pseudoalteromonas sp. SG41-1]MBB1508176.1 hypothetical protein [Pseudoalteromonas sp. SG41-1]
MEEIKLTHPIWIRIIGWVFLPIMLGVSLYCLGIPVWYQRYEVLAILSAAFLGGGCLYMTTHALSTLPFMNADIYVNEDKIEIKRGNQVDVRSWESISKINHVASAQVLHLYDSSGKRFLSVTEQLSGFNILVGYLVEKSGLEL